MFTRRMFLKFTTGGTMLTLFGFDKLTGISKAIAAIPGGTLEPSSILKYETPLLIPPAMPRAGKITVKGGKNIDYYEIAMRQFQQQILPAGFPETTVWGYGPAKARGGPAIFNAPSLTIEAKYNTPVRIKWINELIDNSGNYLPHLLPVDPTLHWANPPGGEMHRDMRPDFTGKTYVPLTAFTDPEAQYTQYTGPVPIVTHVHGAVNVGDESDGYAEAWYLPAANNLPANYAKEGTWYEFFAGKASTKFGVTWDSGFAISQYPNSYRAMTTWYHDHTLGMTRLNVYAGPAGFYIIRGGPSDEVLDLRTGTAAILPGPAPAIGDAPDRTYYEIPLAIQDRSFNTDGSLFYPDTRAFFDEITGPYIPDSDVAPIWNPEFFGNCIMVNGNTWPFQTVEQRRYRFRILNGCNSRFLILDFNNIPGVEVWQIGNDGGFLPASVNLTAVSGNRLLMAPAERVDVIVDFSQVPLGDYVLANVGPDEPFGGGMPGDDFDAADSDSTGQVMQFRVILAATPDLTTPAQFLALPAIIPLLTETVIRPLALIEEMSMSGEIEDAPVEALLGTVSFEGDTTGTWTPHMWADAVTENPAVGATEIWEFYNATGDAHPIHVHETVFEIVNRQAIIVDEISRTVQIDTEAQPILPEPGETGFKDTVIAYPGQVTRIRAQFKTPGQYVWHCHIVEHEDNEMMRPYRIGPEQPGQPANHNDE